MDNRKYIEKQKCFIRAVSKDMALIFLINQVEFAVRRI